MREIITRGSMDRQTVGEIFDGQIYKQMTITIDDIVLDIGGHIGCFAVWANRAKKIYVYEPDPDNFKVLQENVAKFCKNEYVLRNEAIAKHSLPVRLYINEKHRSMNTTSFRDLYEQLLVEGHAFTVAMETIKPTKIKIDCEGAEYDFLDGYQFPDHVQEVIMELHKELPEWKEAYQPLLDQLIPQFKHHTLKEGVNTSYLYLSNNETTE